MSRATWNHGDSTEARYAKALQEGKVTLAQFQRNCASYGITKEKYGSAWDDKCMGYEAQHMIGPVFGQPRTTFYKAIESPYFVPGVIALGGLALYFILR